MVIWVTLRRANAKMIYAKLALLSVLVLIPV